MKSSERTLSPPEFIKGRHTLENMIAAAHEFNIKHPETLKSYGVAIVTCAPNDPHDLGALATATSALTKRNALERAGFSVTHVELPAHTAPNEFFDLISRFNEDVLTRGIIVQLPIRQSFRPLLEHIDIHKDIDGLVIDNPVYAYSATAEAIMRIITPYIEEQAAVAVVGGHGFVGSSVTRALRKLRHKVPVEVLETAQDLRAAREFPIVVAAANKPHILDVAHLREQKVVIDAGFSLDAKSRRGLGNVVPAAYSVVKRITPVPEGLAGFNIATIVERMLNIARHDIDPNLPPLHWNYIETPHSKP